MVTSHTAETTVMGDVFHFFGTGTLLLERHAHKEKYQQNENQVVAHEERYENAISCVYPRNEKIVAA